MLDEHSHLWQPLHNAVRILASGTGTLQERLVNAYISALHELSSENFPEDLRPAFGSVEAFMTAVTPRGTEGSVAATAAQMDDMEATAIAGQIVHLYDAIARECRKEAFGACAWRVPETHVDIVPATLEKIEADSRDVLTESEKDPARLEAMATMFLERRGYRVSRE